MSEEMFPTKEVLDDLREEGIFAYAKTTLRFFEIAFLFLILYFTKKNFYIFQSVIQNIFRGEFTVSLKDITLFFLMIPLCILPFVLLTILFHSKFLFSLKYIITYRFKKFKNKSKNIIYYVMYPIFMIIYLAIIYIFSMEFLSLLNNNYKDIINLVFNNIDKIILSISGIFVILGFLSLVVSRFLFLFKHKMTSEEIEARKE